MNNVIALVQGGAQIMEQDPWIFINSETELVEFSAHQKLILPFSLWQKYQPDAVLRGEQQSAQGFWLAPDEEEEPVKQWLVVVPLIALQFPSFRDGRAYTQAYVLRSRLGWAGELRAVGDVLRDQLSHMRQCGFTSFAIRADKSVANALKGLSGISVLYGRSVIEPLPLFRRR